MNKKILLSVFLVFFLYAAYFASSIFTTFFIALAIAYLLQPVAACISKKFRISYKTSALIVFVLFMASLVGLLSFILPKLLWQMELLLQKTPRFQEAIKTHLLPSISAKLNQFDGVVADQIKNAFLGLGDSFGEMLSYSVNFLWRSLRSTIDLITMCLLLPILLVFFLKDWSEITSNFKNFITKTGFKEINSIWEEVDDLVSGFVKALLYVGFILAVIYTVSLSLIGFEFALIFGIISGFAVMIPFIGPMLAVASCLTMSMLIHGFDYQQILIIIVYVVAQGFDSSFLTPKIVGDKIGLHPTAIIFSIFLGSQLFGFAGLFLAIPTAGIIKIIFNKFILEKRG